MALRLRLLIVLVTGACALSAASIPTAARAYTDELFPVPWTLVNISPSGQYLQIVAEGGGCINKPMRITKTEDATTVALTVELSASVPGPGEAALPCPANLVGVPAGVMLDRPLAGRRLTTLARLRNYEIPAPRAKAPRLLGAQAGDALRALANLGIKSRLAGPVTGTVVRQRPAGGAPPERQA